MKMTFNGFGRWCFSMAIVLLYGLMIVSMLSVATGVSLTWQIYAGFGLLFMGAAAISRLAGRIYDVIANFVSYKSGDEIWDR